MRRLDLTFTALRVPFDFLALTGAAVTAYALRFSNFATSLRPILTAVPFPEYLTTSFAFAALWILLFAVAGLYTARSLPAWRELGRIILTATAGVMVVIALVFFQREVTTSRFLVVAVWLLAIAYVWVGRLLLRLLRHMLLRAKIGHQRLAVIGADKTARDLVNLYAAKPSLGITVVKTIKTWTDDAARELLALLKKNTLDGVLLADPNMAKNDALDLIAFAEEHQLDFRYLADLFGGTFNRVDVSTAGGIPIIEVQRTPLDGWGRIAKRVFDLVVSALLIVVLSPILLLVAIAIKLDSRGPMLFCKLPDGSKTERVGEGGKPFHYFKFRSMQPDTHWQRYSDLAKLNVRRGDPLVKLKNDPRVTRVGRFIRAWSLDELPELFLVLTGKMSLVGPRPHLPEEVEQYKSHHRRVLAIKPGITGLAQISGRADLDFEDEVRLDTWYIENWTPWLDLYVLLKTPFVVVTHKGVEEGT